MEEQYGGAWDNPSSRDFMAEHLLGVGEVEIPESFSLLNTKPKNQGQTMKCTAYGLTLIDEILNRQEHGEVLLDANEQWDNQLATGASVTLGDSLQHALNVLKDEGLKDKYNKTKDGLFRIEGYARVGKDMNEWKKWIAQGYPIYTGGIYTKTNFENAKKTGYWTGADNPRISGHAFACTGYDGDTFEFTNSYGEAWGFFKNGTFKVDPSHFNELYSGYIIYDEKDVKMIFKDVSENSPFAKEIKWALGLGIAKGYNNENEPLAINRYLKPDQPLTRAENIVMLYNLYNKLK